MSSYPSVYIMINATSCRKVVEAYDYQQIALNNYIDHGLVDLVEYGTDTEVCFSIGPFDYKKAGLSGEYDDVYNFIKEDATIFLISRNLEKLNGLCGFINRIID